MKVRNTLTSARPGATMNLDLAERLRRDSERKGLDIHMIRDGIGPLAPSSRQLNAEK